MRVYSLTNVGRQQAKAQPPSEITPAWQILYFLARRGGSSSDDKIYQFAGVGKSEAISALATLRNAHPPLVEVVG
jgi:hypothetical protein